MPGALWRPIPRNYTNRKRKSTRALVLHIAVSEAASLRGWFTNPDARASSHLYVRRDGTIEQYVDLDKISWANGDGNSTTITVETQGMGSGSWTKAQLVALAKIAAFVNERYGVPLVAMKDSKPSSRGIGFHRLGVNPWRVSGGESWSKAYGKICPGPDRIAQVPEVVSRARVEADPATPAKPPASKPAPKPSSKKNAAAKRSYRSGEVKALQRWLKGLGFYKGAIDDDYGAHMKAGVKAWQKAQRYAPGLIADGDYGPASVAHRAWTERLQRTLNGWKGGPEVAVDGDYGAVTAKRVKAVQRRNAKGALRTAARALGYSAGVVDGVPGSVTCRMLGIPTHPGT